MCFQELKTNMEIPKYLKNAFSYIHSFVFEKEELAGSFTFQWKVESAASETELSVLL